MSFRYVFKKIFRPVLVKIGFFRQRDILLHTKWKRYFLYHYEHTRAAILNRLHQASYSVLSEDELRKLRKSDTVFLFGSGYSLNNISSEEWKAIQACDTLGFSGFVYQKFINLDFLLFRGWAESAKPGADIRVLAQDLVDTIESNNRLKNTVLILQGEYQGLFCNTLVGYEFLPRHRKIFRYLTKPSKFDVSDAFPGESFSDGLSHGVSILCDAVNFAYCMGWKKIVLVGVDLYDSRYFWLKPNETYAIDSESGKKVTATVNNQGDHFTQTHSTVRNGLIPIFSNWMKIFQKKGVELSVYNPKSLLKEIMPIFPSRTE